MPKAQTSTFPSYRDSWITSGAIQCGVPMKVLRLLIVRVSCAATPKSASFTSPASAEQAGASAGCREGAHPAAVHAPVSKMLLHLMSRCTLFMLCRYARPCVRNACVRMRKFNDPALSRHAPEGTAGTRTLFAPRTAARCAR